MLFPGWKLSIYAYNITFSSSLKADLEVSWRLVPGWFTYLLNFPSLSIPLTWIVGRKIHHVVSMTLYHTTQQRKEKYITSPCVMVSLVQILNLEQKELNEHLMIQNLFFIKISIYFYLLKYLYHAFW